MVTSKKSGEKAAIKIRYASFPLTFFSIDKTKKAQGSNQNDRWKISNDNRGLIISRMGRQIDVIERTPWSGLEKFRNDDRYWAIEVDFPAELDEEFTIANSKQGVVMSDRIWDILKEAGVEAALRHLRKLHAQNKLNDVTRQDSVVGEPRVSELSMLESEKYRKGKAGSDTPERIKKAEENFRQTVKRKARETQRSENEVEAEVVQEILQHPYKVTFANHPGAPFYRVEQIGGQRLLEINQAHSFFSQVYAAAGADRFIRAGLEVLLFSIGEAELDAIGNNDKYTFYAVEKQSWSQRLSVALESLDKFVHETDIDDDTNGATDVTSNAA